MNNTHTLAMFALLTIVLVTGIYTAGTGTQVVFADSINLNQETKQNANCSTAGGSSSVSGSCNQGAQNSINNAGGIITCGRSGNPTPGEVGCDQAPFVALYDVRLDADLGGVVVAGDELCLSGAAVPS